MSNILVSICCITYNHEKFIADSLDGFLLQKTNFGIEILINDDCSTDNTVKILQEYEKRYPEKFDITYQKENQFSRGKRPLSDFIFPKVKGKYIALCEGDDYWTDPLKLQKQVDFLEKHADYSLCFHKSGNVDKDNNSLPSCFCHLEERDYEGKDILEKWTIPTASVLFRSSFLAQIIQRSKTHKYLYGDTPMFLTLMEYGKSRCLGETMSMYRIHKNGFSRRTGRKNTLAIYKHYNILKKDFDGKYRQIMSMNIGEYTFNHGVRFIKSGNFLDGLAFLYHSLLNDPSVAVNRVFKIKHKKHRQI